MTPEGAREALRKWVSKREAGVAASARSGTRPRISRIRRGFRDAVDRGWIALRSRQPLAQRFPSTSTARRRAFRVLPLLLVGFSALALAQEEVALRVRTILATDTGSEFDSRLDPERHQLKGLFRYSSYRLVKEEQRRCPWGSPNSFEIPGGRYLQVLPISYKNERVKLKVILIEGGAAPPLDTDFSLPNHGNIWVGGPKHPDGVLLISIGAETGQ